MFSPPKRYCTSQDASEKNFAKKTGTTTRETKARQKRDSEWNDQFWTLKSSSSQGSTKESNGPFGSKKIS
ncbi:hypothetical protein MJO29_012205 [Puccinia striiformis f. sp. tritici]|nr:hypothetical protein MJO29_012205 [Puccinia striiformis f. sp. tritici]